MNSEVIAAGRAAAELRMNSRVNIRRISDGSAPTQDETSGLQQQNWNTVYTNLPFRLKVAGGYREFTIAGVQFDEGYAEGHMPVSTSNLKDGDLVEIVSGEWPGTVWRIIEASLGDQRTARRVPLEQTDRPTEWGTP